MACCQCSHRPKAGFLPLLQLPGQVPWGCHCVSCSLVAGGRLSQDCCCRIGESSVLCWSLELKSARKISEGELGWRCDPWDESPSLALEPYSWDKRTEPHIQAGYSLPCPLLVPALWLWCVGMCVKLEVFLAR